MCQAFGTDREPALRQAKPPPATDRAPTWEATQARLEELELALAAMRENVGILRSELLAEAQQLAKLREERRWQPTPTESQPAPKTPAGHHHVAWGKPASPSRRRIGPLAFWVKL